MPVGSPHKMRIYALPLTRARPNSPAFVYYLAHMPRARKAKPESKTATLTKKVIQKAVETWNSWGTMDSGWQVRLKYHILRQEY